MHHPIDRITHNTAFVTPVVEQWLEREVVEWVHHEGSIRRPICTMSKRSYHGAISRSVLSASLNKTLSSFPPVRYRTDVHHQFVLLFSLS